MDGDIKIISSRIYKYFYNNSSFSMYSDTYEGDTCNSYDIQYILKGSKKTTIIFFKVIQFLH